MATRDNVKRSRFRFVQKCVSRRWFLALSATLAITIALCTWVQPDALAAVILVPAWCWLLVGLPLLLLGARRNDWRVGAGVLCVWIVFAGMFVEEPASLLRGWLWPRVAVTSETLRVVTLNCGEGQCQSVRELFAYKPDILLLQEAPAQEAIEELARELFGEDGSFVVGSDCSIIARGKVRPLHPDGVRHFVHAEVELPSGEICEVVSLRLAPPVASIDFWSTDFWKTHAEVRRNHRQQIDAVLQSVSNSSRPVVLGGDFNCPPADAALSALRRKTTDAFQNAGRGWGGTGPSRYPLFRVDQIYTNSKLSALTAWTLVVEHSDHRAVVCDIVQVR